MWNKMSVRCGEAVLLLGAVMVAGCGSVTPELDARFGDAVRTAREQQTLNPVPAAASKDPVQSIDAKAAVNAQERYQDSFKTPPKTFDVLGIGGNLGSGQ